MHLHVPIVASQERFQLSKVQVEPGSGQDEISAYSSCTATEGGEMGLALFEFLMVAMSAVTFPVIFVRKRGGLDGLRSLLPI